MTPVSWMENSCQKPNESIAAFITRMQNSVATKSRGAITNKAINVKEETSHSGLTAQTSISQHRLYTTLELYQTHGQPRRRKPSRRATWNTHTSSRRPQGTNVGAP
jgi:hypothetical protein